ncbi:MAG TPA: DUF2163 domain-containing protein [Vicinamibacterales bacterium]|nr:DUF2163 domain-containing protein [Vicinamibacterales bacterium]
MIPISVALKAHLAQPYQTVSTCWKITRLDSTVLGFTDHDQPITFGGVTYVPTTAYSRSDIEGRGDLSVDNLEVEGPLVLPNIVEADLAAGLWDHAAVEIFIVNWADLTMGNMVLRTGWIGEVSADRGFFKAELRGLTQAYSRIIGQLTSPSCRNNLGDSFCQVDLTPFTVTSTLTGVGADNQTMYDTARTEPGPSGGVVIQTVTKANPGHVTLAAALNIAPGSPVTFSGCLGMTQINAVQTFNNPNTAKTQFDLSIDTSSFSTYTTNSGTATPLGSGTGYFDFGLMTFTSGNNAGLSMEVRSYVPGQWMLFMPMPYLVQVGDAYTMVAGCDKSVTTCHDRFSNVVNFRGEPYLPGIDRMIQTGKQ